MAGYSATPQARKLGLKPGLRVSLVAAPPGWSLSDPPELDYIEEGPADVVIAFVRSAAELDGPVPVLGERIFPTGTLWIAWPRKAAGHISDITDNVVRGAVRPHGLVDVKVAAIDDDWSGLKILWRVTRR
jgi:hypothetical protein